jgi:hypothetical protein
VAVTSFFFEDAEKLSDIFCVIMNQSYSVNTSHPCYSNKMYMFFACHWNGDFNIDLLEFNFRWKELLVQYYKFTTKYDFILKFWNMIQTSVIIVILGDVSRSK